MIFTDPWLTYLNKCKRFVLYLYIKKQMCGKYHCTIDTFLAQSIAFINHSVRNIEIKHLLIIILHGFGH